MSTMSKTSTTLRIPATGPHTTVNGTGFWGRRRRPAWAVGAWLAGWAAGAVAATLPLVPLPGPAASYASAASSAPAPVPPSWTLKLLAINDFHGHLESPGSFRANEASAYAPAGGAEALAREVATVRATHPDTVVVSAGDLVGASPLISGLFHDEPTVEVMNRIGLDFNAVGNHEFDDGTAELLRLQRGGCHPEDPAHSCRGRQVGTPDPFEGAHFQFLAANVLTASGQSLFPAYGLKRFEVAGAPYTVAFIGMTLRHTAEIVNPTGVKGLSFKDEATTVNALVPQLRAQGVDAIVVLVHQGGVQAGAGLADINGCAGGMAGSAIESIVQQLDDAVALVISGHTHAAYNCRLPNAVGRAVPVTSASALGRVVTEVDLTVALPSRRVVNVVAQNRVLARDAAPSANDPGARSPGSEAPHQVAEVAQVVAGYQALVAPLAQRVVGRITADVPTTRNAACEIPAGELIADAQWVATAHPALGGAQLALMNPGGVRQAGFLMRAPNAQATAGQISYGDAFAVQPFGNTLVTMTLSHQQLRDVLEQQFPSCGGAAFVSKVLQPSAGLHYAWDARLPCGSRVRQLTLRVHGHVEQVVDTQGLLLHPQRTVRVTVNGYLAEGGDGFSTFRRGTDRLAGVQDLDALTAYLAHTLAPQPAYDPAAPALAKPRMVRRDPATTCP
jgi:5'-nucleotidase